jgi:hypothetical protein
MNTIVQFNLMQIMDKFQSMLGSLQNNIYG